MSTFIETFTQAQAQGTSIANTPGVTPIPDTRSLTGNIGSTIAIAGNLLSVNLSSTGLLVNNRYQYFTTPLNFVLTGENFFVATISSSVNIGNLTPLLNINSGAAIVGGTIFGSSIIYDLTAVPNLIKQNMSQLGFTFARNAAVQVTVNLSGIQSSLTCVSKNTKILMADGSQKEIQFIKRGDLVAGDLDLNTTHKTSRKLGSKFNDVSKIDIVSIEKDALGENKPFEKLLVSGWHPILWNNYRKPAHCFKNIPNCTWYDHTITTSEILPPDDDNIADENKTYTLYNLQFDTEGFFVANGLVLQSVSPHSNIVPLPKDLFFDEKLSEKALTSESYHVDTKWDNSVLDPELF